MKKILLVLCLCLAISSVAAATPLTDYSLGKTQIDLGLGWASDGTSGVNGDINAHPVEWAINQQFGSGSGGVGNLGVTVGLSSNMALRLKTLMFNGSTYNSPQLPDGSGFTATGYVSDTEFDFMYQALTLDRCPVSLTVLIGFDVPVLGTIFSSNWFFFRTKLSKSKCGFNRLFCGTKYSGSKFCINRLFSRTKYSRSIFCIYWL